MNGSKILFNTGLSINLIFLILLFFGVNSSSFNLELPIITLITPFLIIVNAIFFIYWLSQLKWPAILFLLYLVFGFDSWKLVYQFKSDAVITSKGLDIMSFNIRSFNRFRWLDKENIPGSIAAFIKQVSPDVICFQEFAEDLSPEFEDYPFKVFKPYVVDGHIGSSIISKYPLLNSKAISFAKSSNGGMQSDLIWKRDTFRLYNIHFESLRFDRNENLLFSKKYKKSVEKIKHVFDLQKQQVVKFKDILISNDYPEIICTDLNNNAFSKNYTYLTNNRYDAFTEKGSGFGATYKFQYLPIRIDYIFTSKKIKVIDFNVYDISLSDHKPISATLKWP